MRTSTKPAIEAAYHNAANRQSGGTAAIERLLETYRLTIENNAQKHLEGLRHGLALLQHTLDYQADPALARNLSALYRQVERAAESGRFDIAGEILETIRGLWTARLKIEKLKEKNTFS